MVAWASLRAGALYEPEVSPYLIGNTSGSQSLRFGEMRCHVGNDFPVAPQLKEGSFSKAPFFFRCGGL
jgi:hypothetical protein